jgi:hypothetical protein
VRHAKVGQMAETIDRAIEGAGSREGADVEFVNDCRVERRRVPVGVGPNEGRMIDDA